MNVNEPFPQRDSVEPTPRIHWYVCHNCGWEAWVADGMRSTLGCGNANCYKPNLHVHSNADGERPKTLAAYG